MVKECIHLHIGQAGCQVGSACWELFCQEHEVDTNGQRPEHIKYGDGDQTFESFFQETPLGQFVPRAIFVDTDPTTRNEILYKQPHGKVFHPDNVMGYKQDCKNNYFEGRSMASIFKISEDVMDRIRRTADHCSNLQGFFVFQGFGGGTGSGLGVELLHELRAQFNTKTIIQPVVYPSNHLSNCIVEPYNAVLTTHYSHDAADMSFMVDNQAAYEMCKRNLKNPCPDFTDINRLIAQCISATTTSLRYDTILNASLLEIATNVVPMPRYRYPILSLAPVNHPEKGHHDHHSTQAILTDLFEDKNLLADCGPILRNNRFLAACVLLRGMERQHLDDKDTRDLITTRPDLGNSTLRPGTTGRLEPEECMGPIQANAATKYLMDIIRPASIHRRPVRFVPWVGHGGIKVGVVGVPPCIPKGFMPQSRRQGALIGNTTAVRQLFVRQYAKFCKLYYHKAYIWQFLEANGETECFEEAREGMLDLINSYEDLLRTCVEHENADAGETACRLQGKTELPEMVASGGH